MDDTYYSLPLTIDAILDDSGNEVKTCSEKESIDQFLETLVMTCPGEHVFDKEFGCKIWDMDFVKMTIRSDWEKEFNGYLLEAIANYEHRITEVTISTKVFEAVQDDVLYKSVKIKRKANIIVYCKLKATGELMTFYYSLYLGPISSK